MLDPKLLRSFVAVADELHFGRAAARIGLAQPAVSQHIHVLESRIGTPLFERTTRRIQLTKAGNALLEQARLAVTHCELAEHVARHAATGRIGRASISYSGSALFSLDLPAIISQLRLSLPDVSLRLREVPTQRQYGLLLDGTNDIAFVRCAIALPPPGIEVVTISDEELVVIFPATHRFSTFATITLADLAEENFILREGGPRGELDFIHSICAQAGFQPKAAQFASQIIAIPRLVAAGLGISIVPRSLAGLADDRGRALPLEGISKRFDFSIAWKAGGMRSALTDRVVRIARDTREARQRPPS